MFCCLDKSTVRDIIVHMLIAYMDHLLESLLLHTFGATTIEEIDNGYIFI